jgi:mRNA interferase MazF
MTPSALRWAVALMRRGELYRSPTPPGEPRSRRAYVVVSRQTFIDSRYPTVICAPVYSSREGIATEVLVGPHEGLLHESAVRCDELISLPKFRLREYVGALSGERMREVDRALGLALGLDAEDL